MYDKAMKYTSSENEIKYISILKAKKLADNNQLDQATLLLESLDTDNPLYNELYEEVYGYVLSIS
jgi:hypothetical protein